MADIPPPPSSGPTWLGEYTPPPKPIKPEKLPPRSRRSSRERRSSTRPPPSERKESVAGINVWAPPKPTPAPDPEIKPGSEPSPVLNTIEGDQKPIEAAANTSVTNRTPKVDGLREEVGVSQPPVHQEEMEEMTTGEHPYGLGHKQSPEKILFPATESIQTEAENYSFISSEISSLQGKDDSYLQEGQHYLQDFQPSQQSQLCSEPGQQQQNSAPIPLTLEQNADDYQWQKEHVELRAEFRTFHDTPPGFQKSMDGSGIDLSGTDTLDSWYTTSPRNKPQLLMHCGSFVGSARGSPRSEEIGGRSRSISRSCKQSHVSHSEVLGSIQASIDELPDIKITEDSGSVEDGYIKVSNEELKDDGVVKWYGYCLSHSVLLTYSCHPYPPGCTQCGPFWSVELKALYSILRGAYKDMGILRRAEAEKKETLIQENRMLRKHLKEAVQHTKLLQYELSETAAILQSERSLAKCQNSWLEEMIEKKDTGNLDASNLCELVEEQAQEILAAQSTMSELYDLLENKLGETPVKQENTVFQPEAHITDGLHL